MDAYETALRLIPPRWLDACRHGFYREAEEFRLRVGRGMSILCAGREHTLSGEPLREEELLRTLEKATGASLHSAAEEIARGFVSCQGLRIGICGLAVEQGGSVKGFRAYGSLAIRIPHEARGSCDGIFLRIKNSPAENTLILSPPGGGKTTALRELIRLYADSGRRVGVVDERGEIAAANGAQPGFDLGERSDVISLCGKRDNLIPLLKEQLQHSLSIVLIYLTSQRMGRDRLHESISP